MRNFLARLELQGFKSFAGKTMLEFPSRVTAVVGPNGSGKSNIIDAFRWVLVEREAKQLRGDTLENLIFAGTPKKAAVSVARVSLYFDNYENVLPADGAEAVLSRRVDRSGVSEFTLNENEVKLRDLLPMLAKARMGTRGLMIVGQGQSDIFVRSMPDERRLMIEEILGLREFRIKKNQAERRLDSSRVNMDKVKAMLDELAPHVRILRRQRARFLKRAEVEKELKTLEHVYFYERFHALQTRTTTEEGPFLELKRRIREIEEAVEKQEHELKRMHESQGGYEKAKEIRGSINALVAESSALQRSLARIEARIEYESKTPEQTHEVHEFQTLLKEVAHDIEYLLSLSDLPAIKLSLERWKDRLHKFFGGKKVSAPRALEDEKGKIVHELEAIEKKMHALQTEEETLASEEEKKNRLFRERVEEVNKKKNELHALEQELQRALLDKERVELQREELEREWMSLGYAREGLKQLTSPAERIEVQEGFSGAERKMVRLRGELSAIGEIDENLMKEAEESEARFSFLSTQLEDLEKASKDLKELIEDLDHRIHEDFKKAFHAISTEFNTYFRLMFAGGSAHLSLVAKKQAAPVLEGEQAIEMAQEKNEETKEPVRELESGVEIHVTVPKKRITNLEMLSGGEKTLVSLAALFAMIAVSPPPFLVLDEIDAALDEENARRFAELITDFSKKTQFIIVTHNRATMEAADVLYGITMGDDGVSKVLSMKLEG